MTLKFESEILFDLMKRDGDDAPSDVLPYESELKEKYLNQVVGAYPKLQDYRPEWLNYNLYHHLPSDFPVESVTNVTSASFHDVVPYAYKSAILTGQTLVNCLNATSFKNHKDVIAFNLSALNMVKPSTSYLMYIIDGTNKVDAFYISQNGNNTVIERTDGTKKKVTTTENIIIDNQVLYIYPKTNESFADGDENKINAMLIEYQDGMENWDIPYFEGMQSVKLPVLTTTGKNLFDVESSKKGFYWSSIETQYDDTDGDSYLSEKYIPINEGDVLIANNKQGSIQYMEYDSNKNFMKRSLGVANTPYTVPSGVSFLRMSFYRTGIGSNCQLEKGTKSTPFEPYKTNILTVNEEVELRGIGDVQDELDCLTGKVTERIGEIVLDGSENWEYSASGSLTSRFSISLEVRIDKTLLCADFNTSKDHAGYDEELLTTIDGYLYLRVLNTKARTVDDLKSWLSANPVTLQYPLATESIKTVDLTCINEQGESETLRPIEGTMHVNISSQTLPPLLDMSVPVEATTQNLMSFANIVEEEK